MICGLNHRGVFACKRIQVSRGMKRFAIVVELKDNMERQVRQAWSRLAQNLSISFISEVSVAPHVTLSHGFCGERALIVETFSDAVGRMKPFTISGNGLGIFLTDSPVLHVRWQMSRMGVQYRNETNRVLLGLSQSGLVTGFIEDFNWVAKTSLAYRDFELNQVVDAVGLLRDLDFHQEMLVDSLCLYEYELNQYEKRIQSFSLQ